jgi:hypothetical protein
LSDFDHNIPFSIVQENPMCELLPMKNNEKAYVWSCNDFSEEEAKLEKFACRLQNVESKYKIERVVY